MGWTWIAMLMSMSVAGEPEARAGASLTGDGMSLEELDARGRAAVEARVAYASEAWAIVGGTVMTAEGEVHSPGFVLFRDGQIEAVGSGAPKSVDGYQVVDAAGRYVTPGLIDTHSHLGVYPSPGARAHSDGNEATAPTTPGVWSEHSFWPQDPGLYRAIAGGVTILQALPGSANLIGGRGVVLEVVPARGSRAMRVPGAPETIKMACGENPKRVYGDGGGPSTRMGNIRGQREAFLKAQEYLRRWQDYEESLEDKRGKGEEKARPSRDLDMETLAGVLEGRVLPQIHCYRADDMLSMLQIADEFGFKVRGFHHALEAYKIRDVLAEYDVSISTWADWWGFKMEAYDGIPFNAAMVTEAGGRAVIHSDSAIGIQRLNQEAAKAYYSGLEAGIELSEDDALQWITLQAAWTLGIEDLTGSLAEGKRGDVVLWSGHPFSVTTRAEQVWVGGVRQYDVAAQDNWSDFELGREVVR